MELIHPECQRGKEFSKTTKCGRSCVIFAICLRKAVWVLPKFSKRKRNSIRKWSLAVLVASPRAVDTNTIIDSEVHVCSITFDAKEGNLCAPQRAKASPFTLIRVNPHWNTRSYRSYLASP